MPELLRPGGHLPRFVKNTAQTADRPAAVGADTQHQALIVDRQNGTEFCRFHSDILSQRLRPRGTPSAPSPQRYRTASQRLCTADVSCVDYLQLSVLHARASGGEPAEVPPQAQRAHVRENQTMPAAVTRQEPAVEQEPGARPGCPRS
ncbi:MULTISPECIES: hypothetical protein [Catenuloplanes]|uniref:Uncharacterized protein n=1 Tax=Catenuloplanes niger TaxID=587534 RepID=A0AAE4A141_9ACTN|nr:hypothetical protein [Catenuloplanes niger]MDR7327668.1 hypothetical protein [Catenuloplanes niger]